MPFGVPYQRGDAGMSVGLSDLERSAASVSLEIQTTSGGKELLRDSQLPLFRCRVQRRVPVAGDKIDAAARCKCFKAAQNSNISRQEYFKAVPNINSIRKTVRQ